jgi:hypothetical protein
MVNRRGLLVVALVCASWVGVGLTRADDEVPLHRHPAPDAEIHEQFYSKWLRPDPNLRNTETGARMHSCCNNEDCAPVDGVRQDAEGLWMLRHSDQRWILVPPDKIEYSYEDAHDSPDGRSHMCSTGVTVYCAVLGAGT